ncbi:MAG TPA: hypothetical protein VNA12_07790 [Mycobacteriales bacterium]|nr:hypothetical protein [Mycobacteriales bacterium]
MSQHDEAVAAARAAGKNIGGDGVRELGVVSLDTPDPGSAGPGGDLGERACALLRDEVERMAAARREWSAERAQGAPSRASARLDAQAASLEGATRFALRLGLVSPGQAREIWAAARSAGVHDIDHPPNPDPPANTEEGSAHG